jgi:hypothetical protein
MDALATAGPYVFCTARATVVDPLQDDRTVLAHSKEIRKLLGAAGYFPVVSVWNSEEPEHSMHAHTFARGVGKSALLSMLQAKHRYVTWERNNEQHSGVLRQGHPLALFRCSHTKHMELVATPERDIKAQLPGMIETAQQWFRIYRDTMREHPA